MTSSRDGTFDRRRLLGTSLAAAAAMATSCATAVTARPEAGPRTPPPAQDVSSSMADEHTARRPVGKNRKPVVKSLRPRKLRPGDKVRVVAPGSTPDKDALERGIAILRSWGLTVELGKHVFDKYGYLAGKDEDRLADLNAALGDPEVRGVFTARGGYGCQRIADGIDVSALRHDPKVLVGFSDITSLQASLWASTRLATIHGPMVTWNADRVGQESADALRAAVMTSEKVRLRRDPNEPTAQVMVPGKASGVVLGGNLTLVASSIGTRDELDLEGAIFFFEEVGEENYRIDRMLTQLMRSGGLRKVAGVVVGQVTDSKHDAGEWDAVGVLKDRLGALGVPVLGGLKLGHGTGQLTIPLGVRATMDAEAGTLVVDSAVSDD